MEVITMSRETDRLMMKLPLADVAEWLREIGRASCRERV
jgi:hypothetical protein